MLKIRLQDQAEHEGMNMKLDQEITMLLVERQALNEAIVGEKNEH